MIILFDMDGTLLDTEKYYRKFWRQAANEMGYPMTDEQALSMRSLGKPYAKEHFKALFGENADYDATRSLRKKYMEAVLANEIPLKKGVKETLEKLKMSGNVLAVVTATDEERTRNYLTRTNLLQYFDKIICATMVERGKPAKDVYEYACKVLMVNPENTIAVEDSPNGVKSAHDAGCNVVMIPDQTAPGKEDLYLVNGVCEEICELLDYVAKF